MAVEHSEFTIHAADGTVLFAQRWAPPDATPSAEVLLLHGYAEHGGRYRELAHAFATRGIATLVFDMRGHGRTAGQRGHIASFHDYLDDAATALDHIASPARFVLGHSNGGLVALDWVSRRQPSIAGLVVANPFLALAAPLPAWKSRLGKVAARLAPRLALPAGLDPGSMSHDTEVVEAYRRDPMVFTSATAGYFHQAQIAQQRVAQITEIGAPLLYVYSDSDPVAAPAASERLSAAIRSPDKTVLRRTGELHEVLNELQRAELHGTIADWLLRHVPTQAPA